MDASQKEYYINQIVSGISYCRLNEKVYVVRNPSIELKFYAQEIYNRVYEKAKEEKVYDENEMLSFLLNNSFWSVEEEDKLEKITREIPELKIKIYELMLKTPERELIRKALQDTNSLMDSLLNKKHSFDYLTAHGIAAMSKFRFLVGCSLYSHQGKPYWKNPIRGWEKPDYLIDNVTHELLKTRLNEKQIRELSRSDIWRGIWTAGKYTGGLFGIHSVNLTEYQRTIILYSNMYDNIHECSEPPSESIIDDDDALDGWLLLRKRKNSEEGEREQILGSLTNEKIKNAEEVFVPVGSTEDAKKVFEVNDIAGKVAFSQRMKEIKEKGEVREQDLFETRQRVLMDANKNFMNSIK